MAATAAAALLASWLFGAELAAELVAELTEIVAESTSSMRVRARALLERASSKPLLPLLLLSRSSSRGTTDDDDIPVPVALKSSFAFAAAAAVGLVAVVREEVGGAFEPRQLRTPKGGLVGRVPRRSTRR
eukprot:GHVU01067566.1.p3 GENE.GHVU01067566.1~~GHVU01067566.1.p3  ORF type:complete len:146 (-),score=38.61 GHVU01067566.1:110-499(-)